MILRRLNRKSWLMGAMAAATLLVTPVVFGVPGSGVHAQGGEHRHPFASLNLSESQQTEIQTIRQATRSQIEAILTEAQRQQLASAAPAGPAGPGGMIEALRSLDLDDQQRQQLHTIHTDARSAIQAVLTPEQQQQLEQLRQEHQANGRAQRQDAFAQLDLSSEQEAQLSAIRQDTRSQIEALLTEEQRQQATDALQSETSTFPQVMRSLNLSDRQRQQVRSILEASREEALNVLTDAQRQQLEQLRPQGPRGHRNQGHRPG